MTYKEHIREVAAEMACNYWNQNKSNAALRFEQLSSDIQEVQILKMLTTARIAVRLRDEAVRNVLIPVPDFYCKGGGITENGKCTNQCGICANLYTSSENKLIDHDTHH